VNTLVNNERSGAGEQLPAAVTQTAGQRVSLFSGMHGDVRLEVRQLAERPVTDVAVVRLLPGMNAPVLGQCAGHAERLVADLTRERALAAVTAGVAHEVTLQAERGVAHLSTSTFHIQQHNYYCNKMTTTRPALDTSD